MRLLVSTLLLALIGASAEVRVRDRSRPTPTVNLGRSLSGKALIKGLGTRLKDVAAHHNMTEAGLRAAITKDSCLHADKTGRLNYICPALPNLQNARAARANTASGSQSSIPAGPFPEAQTFFLHSLPGASKVLYLDFNGHTTTGTVWNSNHTGGAPIISPAYDTDNVAGFSSAELTNIQQIWQQVAEDFAPFGVDVTTEDPGVAAITWSNPADQNYGQRVVIGGSSYDWYGAGAGGVAYLDSFGDNKDTPVFIFEAQLGNGSVKYTAEACSHESGHSFGLLHDGTTTGDEYYAGHASGVWAPIMGVSYYKDVTQWSKGEYGAANNLQDDVLLIGSVTGMRADDHGDSTAAATVISGTTATITAEIASRSDRDYFRFATDAGPVSITVSAGTLGPDLNTELTVYDSAGVVIATVSPTTGLGATFSQTLAQGTYYARVDGVGEGVPSTSGYSDYGSLGAYTLQLSTYEQTKLHVAGIAMSLQRSVTGTMVSAAVRVVNQHGQPVPGALVSGTWSGPTTGSMAQSSGTGGQTVFASPRVSTSGHAAFTITDVRLPGAAYLSTANVETDDGIDL